MSRPRHYSQAAEAKRTPPDQIEPEDDDDEQFEWYDEEPEPEDDKEWVVSEKRETK